jgi:hypothetical protein
MDFSQQGLRFGYAWVAFALAIAGHVTDEAANDFLSLYNPIARTLRERFYLPLPVFTFEVWLAGLGAGILLLLVLSPMAFRFNRVLRMIAVPLAVIVGLLNAAGHIAGSIYFGYLVPGVDSTPLLVITGIWLLLAADKPWRKTA